MYSKQEIYNVLYLYSLILYMSFYALLLYSNCLLKANNAGETHVLYHSAERIF